MTIKRIDFYCLGDAYAEKKVEDVEATMAVSARTSEIFQNRLIVELTCIFPPILVDDELMPSCYLLRSQTNAKEYGSISGMETSDW